MTQWCAIAAETIYAFYMRMEVRYEFSSNIQFIVATLHEFCTPQLDKMPVELIVPAHDIRIEFKKTRQQIRGKMRGFKLTHHVSSQGKCNKTHHQIIIKIVECNTLRKISDTVYVIEPPKNILAPNARLPPQKCVHKLAGVLDRANTIPKTFTVIARTPCDPLTTREQSWNTWIRHNRLGHRIPRPFSRRNKRTIISDPFHPGRWQPPRTSGRARQLNWRTGSIRQTNDVSSFRLEIIDNLPTLSDFLVFHQWDNTGRHDSNTQIQACCHLLQTKTCHTQ